mgnify:CR=1 FL=1
MPFPVDLKFCSTMQQTQIIKNPNVLGIAWAVDSLIIADTADEVLESMKSIDFKKSAVVLKSELPDDIGIKFNAEQLNKIELVKNHPTHLLYNFEANEDQLLVFSEMYYPQGWSVTIDDQKAKIFPVNYVLRGLKVPYGKHTIEFTFDPSIVKTGVVIRLLTLLMFISILSFFGYQRFKEKSNSLPQEWES